MIRCLARDGLRRFLQWRSRELGQDELAASAVVFSPHPDDETLGCGGTILRKKQAGADVKVVFMTDGSISHRKFIPEMEMRVLRQAEALDACRILGLDRADVFFLDFKDGQLADHHGAAIERAGALLRELSPSQVFLPYDGDTTRDHEITNAVVLAAVRQWRRDAVVYEYPVWYWHHWPWVPLSTSSGRRDMLSQAMHAIRCWVRLSRHLRWTVPIGACLERKRTALGRHRSQTERLVNDPGWLILSDISNGEFLECFFQPREMFYRHIV